MGKHQHVFETPKDLPQSRDEHDHVIPLILGSRPPNVRPYRHPFAQKKVKRSFMSNWRQNPFIPTLAHIHPSGHGLKKGRARPQVVGIGILKYYIESSKICNVSQELSMYLELVLLEVSPLKRQVNIVIYFPCIYLFSKIFWV